MGRREWAGLTLAVAVLIAVVFAVRLGQPGAPVRAGEPLDPRVSDLLGQMTLREKVGQMTQLEIGMISEGEGAELRIDDAKLRKVVVEYGAGSILNIKDVALPLEQWRQIVTRINEMAQTTRLKIPVVYGLDSVHGANYIAGATIFPQPLGMAATWNPGLVREAARISAMETRAAGAAWNFAPILDLGRQPLWSRLYETYGEDPYLVSVLGAAAVHGMQGDDPASPAHVAATLKHYVGYGDPRSGRDRTPALIPDTVMREYFLPPFRAGVEAGALSVMVNSGSVNGVPGHVNRHLLQDVLRGEMGFTGLIVSDWDDIRRLANVHHVATGERDATRQAILAGIDMSMVPSAYTFTDLLEDLVRTGDVPESRIDDAVARILTLKLKLGLFDDPLRGTAEAVTVGAPESRAIALDAARQSIVLARNGHGALPIAAGTRVLVTGPTADSLPALNNGWTISWQGDRVDQYPADRPTVRRALEASMPGRVTYVPGSAYAAPIDLAAAVRAARAADVAIVCLGELSYAETPGDIDDLTLPEAQLSLARAVAGTGTPMVLVLIEGRPRLVRPVVDAAAAVVIALNPGHEGGQAIAEVLTGAFNPSGRLPITYPRYTGHLLTDAHTTFEAEDHGSNVQPWQPEFAFGAGLSYTTFAYSGLQVAPAEDSLDAATTVRVTVANTGDRAGAEVVQVYVSDLVASIVPPARRLRAFQRVELAAGESRDVSFTLERRDLSFVGASGEWTAEPGEFDVSIGGLSQKIMRTQQGR